MDKTARLPTPDQLYLFCLQGGKCCTVNPCQESDHVMNHDPNSACAVWLVPHDTCCTAWQLCEYQMTKITRACWNDRLVERITECSVELSQSPQSSSRAESEAPGSFFRSNSPQVMSSVRVCVLLCLCGLFASGASAQVRHLQQTGSSPQPALSQAAQVGRTASDRLTAQIAKTLTITMSQAPSNYYPENSPSDPTFLGYNQAGYNPYGRVNNAITAFNLVSADQIVHANTAVHLSLGATDTKVPIEPEFSRAGCGRGGEVDGI